MLGNPEPDRTGLRKRNSSQGKCPSDFLTKGVSFKQLQACGQGCTVSFPPLRALILSPQVLWILLDANQFWLYDNRESLPHPEEGEDVDDDYEEESPYSSDDGFEEESGDQGHSEIATKVKASKEEDGDDLYDFY
jgi:hypothetical protein